jgi:hypothetical protein
VEPQQVVLVAAEAADRRVAVESAVGPVPVIGVGPGRELAGPLMGGGACSRCAGPTSPRHALGRRIEGRRCALSATADADAAAAGPKPTAVSNERRSSSPTRRQGSRTVDLRTAAPLGSFMPSPPHFRRGRGGASRRQPIPSNRQPRISLRSKDLLLRMPTVD